MDKEILNSICALAWKLEDVSSELYYFTNKHGYNVGILRNARVSEIYKTTIIEEVIDKLEETKSFIEDTIEEIKKGQYE